MEKQRLFAFSFLLAFFALVGTVLFILSPFAKPILWGVIFTIISLPLHNLLTSRFKSHTLSALFITAFVLFAFVVPLGVMGIITLKEVLEFSRFLIGKYKSLSVAEIQRSIMELPLVSYLIKYLPKDVVGSKELARMVLANLKVVANFSAAQLKSLFLSTGVTLSKLFIFIFTFFFLLKDASAFGDYIYRYLPFDEEDKRFILSNIYLTTLSVVYGTLGTALAQGTLGLLIYLLLGVPYPFLWAFATAYASFIPPFGASMVWFPVAVYLFFKVSWVKGIAMLVLGTLVVSSMDNVVKPLIMKNRVNAPYIVIFFAIFGGLIKFGFIGMFLGPILFNLLFTVAKIYETKFLR